MRDKSAFELPRSGGNHNKVMASGLSGPRRVHLGSARDCVLGVRLINGLGQHLKFGGEVMKNVAAMIWRAYPWARMGHWVS